MSEKQYAIITDSNFSWALHGSVLEIVEEETKTWNGQEYTTIQLRGSNGNIYYASSEQIQKVKVEPIND